MLRDASDWMSEALARSVSTSFHRCCRPNPSLSCAGQPEPAHEAKKDGTCVQIRHEASSHDCFEDLRVRSSPISLSDRNFRKRGEVNFGSYREISFEDNRSGRCVTSRYGWSNPPYFMFILLLMVSCSGYSSGVAAHCEKGVKYFDKDSATCVPCSECKRPLYAIIPCYEFMDTVCDNPAEFLSEHSGVGILNVGGANKSQPNLSNDENLLPNRSRQSSGRASSGPGRRGRRRKNERKRKRRKNGRKRKNKNLTEQSDDRFSNANSNTNANSMHDDYNNGSRDPVFENYPDYDVNYYEYSDYLEYWDALRAEYEQSSRSPNMQSPSNPDINKVYTSESLNDTFSRKTRVRNNNGNTQAIDTVGLNEANPAYGDEYTTGNSSKNINSTFKNSNNSNDGNVNKINANNDPVPKSELDTVTRPRFEMGKLWRNGWTTAIVLALVIVVGLMAVALIIVLGMQVCIYSKNRIDRMKDKTDYEDGGGGFSSAVLLHQSPSSPILATSDAHHLQQKLKDSDEKDNDVIMGGGSLPMSRPKTRKLGFTLGRGSKEKIFHVARTYKPAPCRSKFGSSQDFPPLQERLMTLAPNSVMTQNSAFIECPGTTYCSGEWLEHNCIPHGFEGGSKETTFTSLSSANNSPPLSPLSDGPVPQSFAPKPPVRLTKSQEEKILRSSNASSNSTPIVDCVLTSNVVTFDDGSTLSTTTNYTTNPRPSNDRVLTHPSAYPYSQTLPTTYVRTSSRTSSSDHQQNTGTPPSSSGSAHGGTDVSPSFPAILESKGSPIPYTMDRLLEQRRRLGCASSVDTNIYVEMWRGSSAAPSNNPSAVPSPALQHRTTTSTTSVPSSSSSTHPAGEDGVGAGDSFAALERNLATLSRGIESLHVSTRGSSPSGTSGGSPSLRRGGGGSSNNSSICSSRLAHRLTAHLNSVAAANTLQGSPKLTLRHFK